MAKRSRSTALGVGEDLVVAAAAGASQVTTMWQRQRDEAAGDGPDVQVVHRRDAGHLRQRGGDLAHRECGAARPPAARRRPRGRGGIALQTMVAAMRKLMMGSTSSRPVQAISAAETSTPTELSRSPARWRKVERRFMLPCAPECVIHIPTALRTMPSEASRTTVCTWTGSGFSAGGSPRWRCRRRWRRGTRRSPARRGSPAGSSRTCARESGGRAPMRKREQRQRDGAHVGQHVRRVGERAPGCSPASLRPPPAPWRRARRPARRRARPARRPRSTCRMRALLPVMVIVHPRR